MPDGVRRLLALAVALAACLLAASPAHAAYTAKVTRTSYGIAHVAASDLGSAGYGTGYAAAQDNICELASAMLTVTGQRSRFLGPTERAFTSSGANTNLESDFFWTSVAADRTVESLLNAPEPVGPSADARALVTGWATGYNRYLSDVGGAAGVSDPHCRGAAWVRPISSLTAWKRMYQIALLQSGAAASNISDAVAAAPPSSASTTQESPKPTPASVRAALRGTPLDPRASDRIGSNAAGLGRDATRAGTGMVFGNPHLPWSGSERMWQFSLSVPGKLHTSGATLLGMPVVAIGFNDHVGWSHTVSTARRFSLARLTLSPSSPTSYVQDGVTHAMRKTTVSVLVKDADGVVRTRTHDWYATPLGRVTTVPSAGLGWTTSNAYVFDDANAGNLRIVDAWLDMGRATSTSGLYAAQKRDQALPWINTVAADDQGNAFYSDMSVVPNLPQAKLDSGCVGSDAASTSLRANRVYMLDGSRAACAPGTDADATRPGVFGPGNLPTLTRSDYTQNSNDSFWQTNPNQPLTANAAGVPFSEIIGPTRNQQLVRTRLGVDMISRRIAGTDGLGAAKYTLDTLQASFSADRNGVAEVGRSALLTICQQHPTIVVDGRSVDVREACPLIAAYDPATAPQGAGSWLFTRWADIAGPSFADEFDPGSPIHTPNKVSTTAQSNIDALGRAVAELRDRGVSLSAKTTDVQHSDDADGTPIPVHGCAGNQCYDAMYSETGTNGYGRIEAGSGFVMTVELSPSSGPRAQTVLAYSQSSNPASPFFSDQTKLFAAKRWVALPYTDAEIAADAKSSLTLTNAVQPPTTTVTTPTHPPTTTPVPPQTTPQPPPSTSPTVSTPTHAPTTPPGPPATSTVPPTTTTTPAKRTASRLRIRSIKRARRSVRVSGTLTRLASGHVRLLVRVRRGSKTKTIRGRATIRKGRFAASLRTTTRWREYRVSAIYDGSTKVLPAAVVRR